VLLSFLAGTALTWSSPEIPKLTNTTTSPFGRTIDEDEASWISSLVTLGAALGPYLFCLLADKMGRKYTLLAAGVPFLVCYLVQAFGHVVELFYVTRLVMGLTVGGVFTLIPIYSGEVADKSERGVLGALISCAVCTGFLFSYSLGPFVSVMVFNLILAALSAVFLVLFAFLGKEVPHYYISINEEDLAKEALQKLRGGYTDIDEELWRSDQVQGRSRGKLHDLSASKD
ncbi:Facilitated trehalose transporter Tret1, partial [Gonioctena quinquepunctata]